MMVTDIPLDMTKTEPPTDDNMTSIKKKTPSCPREFFAKIYGTKEEDSQRQSAFAPLISPLPQPQSPISLPPSPTSSLSPPKDYPYPPMPPNANFLPGMPPPYFTNLHHLPNIPLSPAEATTLRLEGIPFPGGLAAFCK